jgi:zinc/manganese transport system substrate-binding protein
VNGNHSRPVRRTLQLAGLLGGVAVLVLSSVACTGDDSGDGPLVVATHSLLGDLTTNVFGADADVQVVMPAGSDPHEFEPSAAQIALVNEADLVVANGLGFEAGLQDALDAAAGDGVPVLELGESLDPLPLDSDPHADEAPDEEEHGEEDPHWFTDPLRMARAAGLVAGAAAEVEGLDPEVVADRAADHAAALEGADAEIAAALAAVPEPRRRLVTNHEVFGYFADRYGFEVLGVVIPGGSTLAGASAADLDELAHEIEEHDVPAIFADSSSPTRLADALASEGADVEVVELYSESLGEAGSPGETYIGMIRTNAERIAAALT